MNLRPYQTLAVANVMRTLDRRPILVAPTGSGKTVMGAEVVRRLAVPTLWVAHRTELITQAAAHMDALGLRAGIIKASHAGDPRATVQVASVQTLVNRDAPPAGVIVIDECHHATAGSYQAVLDAYPETPVVGLTATPFRLDGRGLGDVFGEIVVAARTDELVRQGYLHAPRVFAGRAPDLRGARVRMGDYSLTDLAERTNTTELCADIVSTWISKSAGRRTVVFAINIEHSLRIVLQFQAAGVTAEHIDGATPPRERAEILERLRSGRTQIVSNCMVLTEGWDLPALETAIIARPTASLNLHLQMVGRIMRRCDDKRGAIVLDHAGNHHVHGLVTRHIEYRLDGRCVGENDPLGLRRCQSCQLLFTPTEVECPDCGWQVPPAPGREIAYTGDADGLTEYVEDHAYKAEVWRLIEAERQAMGFKPGWAAYRYHERFGEWPTVADGELVDLAHPTMDDKRAVYADLLRRGRARGFHDGWASHQYREKFGCWPSKFVSDVKAELAAAGIGETEREHVRRRWAARRA